MTHDLTVAAMFQQADWVVKTVMGVLVLASVATLSIWIFKTWEIVSHRRAMARALQSLSGDGALASFAQLPDPAAAAMVQAAIGELERVPAGQRSRYAEGIKERTAARIQRVEAGQQRRLSRGASVLGSIGAAAPFIGLFGTVWGIMNSFIGIAHSQTTNLAVVAPGIAEALLATAFGLVAAIPAVLVYNAVTRAIAGYRVRMNDAATQVMCLLSRELESGLDPQRNAEPHHGI
ncbi:tonB-system energizer ExbB [Luteimonas sp. XNQY3]|nr:tonB-system energizer ExbB [Luteimonas sp. XNQY3]MCD9004975.1 tonB-system energizer ExbB [Luteimonas sp. XNQY3]